MDWVALGRRTGGRKINSNLSPKYSLSFAPLASSLILTILLVLTVTLTLATIVHAGDIFEEGKSDKEILDNLLLSTRYDKRLLPPVQGTLQPPPHTRQDDYIPYDHHNHHHHHHHHHQQQQQQQQQHQQQQQQQQNQQHQHHHHHHHHDLEPNDQQSKYPAASEHLEHHQHQQYHHTSRHNHSSKRNDADFCCGMRSPGDASILSNEPPSSSSSSSSSSPSHVKLLQTQNNSHYTPHQHLRTHLSGTLTVNVSVLLLSLASPDESSLKYEVEFLLQQQWYDPRLRYSNRSRYEFLNAIHHHNDIWLPDTYFIMHGDFKDPLIPVHFALRIYRNGTVNYLMRRHLILSCQGRLNIFPFDDPQCSFAIESISYEQTAITYVWKNDEATLRKSPSLTTLNAYLIRNQTIACPIKASWRGNYSCLKVDLIFTRDRAFYFTTVFIPGIILVTSSFITFWLEWNAVPARVMIGVTTMLNFFTTSNGFRSTLPVVSNLTAMNVWDGVCMCFIYASLLEFVCVNYVGRKRPLHNVVYRPGENPVTQRLPAVLSRIGIILASPLPLSQGEKKREGGNQTSSSNGPNEIISCTNCGPNPCTHTANNGCAAEVRKKEPPHPIRVAKTIDVIARITFPIAYFFFLTFFFIHYKGAT
ncbi:glutamate-gated chloride channel-like isoform X3 [Aphidius gifuensis]|nr:glutamate-gated chloride channel-like isoform X3 [Aphidius gifuensis]